MFGFLVQCLRLFGWKGLVIYLKIKFDQTASVSMPGLKFPVTMRPNRIDKITFREIFIKREYDVNLPKSINPTVIIDAGANIGFTSLFFANRYPQAKIFSIEPDESNYNILRKNTEKYTSITPLKSALWNRKETIQVVDRGYGERGYMIEKNNGGNKLEGISLNDFMTQYKLEHIDILKIDIEGSEKEVFTEHFHPWLSVTKCLIIELHDRMKSGCSKAVFKALSEYDFSLAIKGENLVFIQTQYLTEQSR